MSPKKTTSRRQDDWSDEEEAAVPRKGGESTASGSVLAHFLLSPPGGFDVEKDDWQMYQERLEEFFEVNSINETKKPLQSLVFLREFIERYERYKENILYQRNSLIELTNEVPSETICNKSRASFKITKPRSVLPSRPVRKSPRRQRNIIEDKINSVEGLKHSLRIDHLKAINKKERGVLCTDSSKRNPNDDRVFKVCKAVKRKCKKKKRTSMAPTTSETVVVKEREKPNLSKALIELQDMDIDQVIKETDNLIISSGEAQSERASTRKRLSKETLPVSKDEDVSKYCDKDALSVILEASKYTKSERDVLLGEFIEFEKNEGSTYENQDFEEKGESSQQENIQIERGSNYRSRHTSEGYSSHSKYSETKDIKREIDERSEQNTSLLRIDEEGEGKNSPLHLLQSLYKYKTIIGSSGMEGTLFKKMAKYYPAKIESMTNIKKNLDDKLTPEFKEILEIVLQDFGLPENETLLKELLSNNTEILTNAQDYENIVKQKISRSEMYKSKDTEDLEKLFQTKFEQEKDLLAVLAPFLCEMKKQQEEEKLKIQKSPTSKSGKKGKHKKGKIAPLDGPFNIMKRGDIRRNVWRAALKRAKKKIKFLNDTVEHRKKTGLAHDKYHAYFKDYFKKKRAEVKRLRKSRTVPVLVKARNVDLSEAETTTSFSSGDHYPEKSLMKSIFYDYDELKDDFDVPVLRGRKHKVGKIEKLRREKKRERAGVESSSWAPYTETQLISWPAEVVKKSEKRRARVIEDYVYSSADELIGYNDKQKVEKRKVLWELAESLIPDDIPKVQSETKLTEEKQDIPKEKESYDETKKMFATVCMKYKMHHIYNLITCDKILKPPYDEQFMASVRKMGESLSQYDNNSSFHTSVIKKFLKMAVRTSLGMFYIMQKENRMFDETCKTNDKAGEGNVSSDSIPLQWLLKNATIQEERNSKWLKRFLGLENSLKTEEKMSLYFGPPAETYAHFGPLNKKQ